MQKYILQGWEGELLDTIRQSRARAEGVIDLTCSLVDLVERQYIHTGVALETTPKPEELKMRLKGIF